MTFEQAAEIIEILKTVGGTLVVLIGIQTLVVLFR